jgi:hypothetical protein
MFTVEERHMSGMSGEFTIHWAPVTGAAADRFAAEKLRLLALWPAPVNDDKCFREAGFTEFGDADEQWEKHAGEMLTRLMADLAVHGTPRLLCQPVEKRRPWYGRLFSQPQYYDLREHLELSLRWDNIPDCVVGFGESEAQLRTGKGHHIFWITLPQRAGDLFGEVVPRIAGSHPFKRTDLHWECLIG